MSVAHEAVYLGFYRDRNDWPVIVYLEPGLTQQEKSRGAYLAEDLPETYRQWKFFRLRAGDWLSDDLVNEGRFIGVSTGWLIYAIGIGGAK